MSSRIELTEGAAIIRARSFVNSCGIDSVPVDIEKFLAAAKADLRETTRLGAGTAGSSMQIGDRHVILVNAADSPERRRFTVLHEIAHIVLDLPSNHGAHSDPVDLYSYVRRPPEEVICDTFAAECLLPEKFVREDMKSAVAGFDFVEKTAERYQASLSCAASRVAANASYACAYVLSQGGYVRYSTYSPTMRQSRFFVRSGIQVPSASVTGQCLAAGKGRAGGTVAGYIWTNSDGFEDVDLSEDVRMAGTWDQAYTLLWLADGDVPDDRDMRRQSTDQDDEVGGLLRELDGNLPWPGRGRRR